MEAGRLGRGSRWVLPILFTMFASTQCAQDPRTANVSGASAALPEFEIVSVKPTDLRGDVIVGTTVDPGGRVQIEGCELQCLIRIAFHLSNQRISGGAAWTEQVKYNVEALPPKEAAIKNLQHGVFEIADERLRQMLQSLLIRRFQLQFHRATEMGNVYVLKRGRKQPALHSTDAAPSSAGRVRILWSKQQLALDAATMPQLAEFLSDHVFGAPVLDRTGLSGRFDYVPENTAPLPPDAEVDLIAAAMNFIQETHLELERTKGPVEIFVIDRGEKPSPN